MVYPAIVNVKLYLEKKKNNKNENKFALVNHHNMLISLVLFDAFATPRRKCNYIQLEISVRLILFNVFGICINI